MSAIIPEALKHSEPHVLLEQSGLKRIHQGKVRDTYQLAHPGLLAVVATDRISIFDFVLPALVPHKGEILTALTVFWLRDVFTDKTGIRHHLVAAGRDIDLYLPQGLRGNPELWKRMLIVKKLNIIPVECVVRGYLTGSGWRSYAQTGKVHGISVPPDLHDGSHLKAPLFDPTTKAEHGHDEPLEVAVVVAKFGAWLGHYSLDCYRILAYAALERGGLLVADTKFEFGQGGILADEVGTPDSSRFWDCDEAVRARQKRVSPPPYDKEVVRNWGKQVPLPLWRQKQGLPDVGLHNLDPANLIDVAFVQQLQVPQRVLEETGERYHTVFKRLTGMSLQEFQEKRLNGHRQSLVL